MKREFEQPLSSCVVYAFSSGQLGQQLDEDVDACLL